MIDRVLPPRAKEAGVMKRLFALTIAWSAVAGGLADPYPARADVGLTLHLVPPTSLGGGLYQYHFFLDVNNPGSWTPGQGYGGLIFGDVRSANAPSPISDFTMTSAVPGPWTGLGDASGFHNGPSFRPTTDASLNPIIWTPANRSDRLDWYGTSSNDTTDLLWSTLFTTNGATPANFTPVVVVPEPSPLVLGLACLAIGLCASAAGRRWSPRRRPAG
jgi:hypothetical protein